ncbi:hypothetical protein [Dactylosporangium sp. CS-033363]|uniref:hypothetical protein n=1 Tax=Dactylosporangium sp. CS-033363 TaxID=3239935 RepID=UPI003D921C00
MDAELVALASSAATALVGAMAKDGWQAVRAGVARLLGRGDARAEQAALETLDEDAAGLRPGGEAEVTGAWAVRLKDLLRADPEAAAALRDLLTPDGGGAVSASGSALAAGRDVHVQAAYGGVAAGTIQGPVTTTAHPTSPGTGEV